MDTEGLSTGDAPRDDSARLQSSQLTERRRGGLGTVTGSSGTDGSNPLPPARSLLRTDLLDQDALVVRVHPAIVAIAATAKRPASIRAPSPPSGPAINAAYVSSRSNKQMAAVAAV